MWTVEFNSAIKCEKVRYGCQVDTMPGLNKKKEFTVFEQRLLVKL